jgi:hypothetical protein
MHLFHVEYWPTIILIIKAKYITPIIIALAILKFRLKQCNAETEI